jgi:hypothetical protein
MVLLRFGDKEIDVTSYLREHPGGPEVLEALAGQDALKAFQEVGHSAKARRRLAAFLEDDAISAAISPASVRQKLFTAEDPYNLHKTLGVLVAFHFLVLRLYGHFVTPLPFVAAPLAAVGCGVLALSSLRFHVPRASNRTLPAIHAVFRGHNIVFALRSVVCSLANAFLAPRTALAIRVAAVLATRTAADLVEARLRASDDDYRTTATMPYWPGCSDARRRCHQLFYSFAQFGATNLCFFEDALRPLDACIGIQGAAFALTLSRKGILSAYGYHIVYTCQLLYVIALGAVVQIGRRDRSLLISSTLLRLARRSGYDKYLLWGLMALVAWHEGPDGDYASTPRALAAALAALHVSSGFFRVLLLARERRRENEFDKERLA